MSVFGFVTCSSDDPAEADLNPLMWTSCSDESELECATLKVPRKYNTQNSEEIDIAINRLNATTQPATGVLLINPGGPGGSGKELLDSFEEFNNLPENVRAAYDIIGFDPRGVGQITPVDCSEFVPEDSDSYIINRSEIDFMLTQAAAVVEQCIEKYGDYLQDLGSLNVVRDMDEIRKKLTVDTINFLGYSYGTRLGALYLQTYPSSSGAFILDASLKPDSGVLPLIEEALPTLEKNLDNILRTCRVTAPDCDPEQLYQQLTATLLSLSSMEDKSDFELLGELLIIGVQSPEFGDFLASPLIAYLETGDISVLQNFVILIEGILGSPDDDTDSDTATNAVLCADDAWRPTAEDLEQALERFNEQSGIFAEASLTLVATCAAWPQAIEPLPLITSSMAPVSLVIGGASDAQTPTAWSSEMAESIGGIYLPSNHEGHGVVFSEQNDCIDKVAENFLLTSQLPSSGACAQNTND